MITGKYLFVFVLLIAVLAVSVYSGTFQQDSGSAGIVSMEAENYSEKAAGSGMAAGISWASTTSPTSYSGTGAMEAILNTGKSCPFRKGVRAVL